MDKKLFVSYRKKIDKIDNKIIKLLEKRLKFVREIGKYKKKHGMKIIDRKREKEIIDKILKESGFDKMFVKKFYNLLFTEIRRLQKKSVK